jgi:hypothetical protein
MPVLRMHYAREARGAHLTEFPEPKSVTHLLTPAAQHGDRPTRYLMIFFFGAWGINKQIKIHLSETLFSGIEVL